MTATKQFIEDAEKGGYRKLNTFELVNSEKILLDPKAWQAVGKTRGWNRVWLTEGSQDNEDSWQEWVDKWHQFIDYLADGKSIEEALSAMSN